MADTDHYSKHKQLKTEENRANPSKFYTHFLYKALIVSVFLVILPLFPSEAPEFISQTLFTRSWELLHLLFVGIAVSYGLFSHRNDETEKENNNHSKLDNAQTYVSKFLQVSSVFDDESEDSPNSDENKMQTWSNQYYRNEPVVVVAKEHSVLDQEQRVTSSRTGEKPLLLPVRSLKSRVLDSDIDVNSPSLSRSSSNSGSRRFSSNSNKRKNGELGGFDHENLGEKLNENVVLPSPIPWRSRSGRLEMKENVDSPSSPMYSMPSSMDETEFNRQGSPSLRPQLARPSSRSNSTSSTPKLSPSTSLSSPKKLSPSPSFSSESQAKNSEDFVRKRSFYRPPPPPPPPPLPAFMMKSSLAKQNCNEDFPANLKVNSGVETKARSNLGTSSMGKSVRKTRSNESGNENEDGFKANAEKGKGVTFDQTSSFKNVSFMPKPTFMEYPKQENDEFVDKVTVEEHDEDSESDYEDDMGENAFVSNTERSSNNEEGAASSSASDGGPDVDKKADEFIAKFREQIRLQRIESIKRSSAQISIKSSR